MDPISKLTALPVYKNPQLVHLNSRLLNFISEMYLLFIWCALWLNSRINGECLQKAKAVESVKSLAKSSPPKTDKIGLNSTSLSVIQSNKAGVWYIASECGKGSFY